MENKIKLGKYQHFKGHDVKVFGVAKHSEDPEQEFVVYEHDGQLWVRPFAMFLEDVEVNGQKVPRFKYVGE
ncbi:MAG: DUF1653 domain-containing protein [Patescibacteria group bacterium]